MSEPSSPLADTAALVSPVRSHNEWDPLEEVVGRLEGATMPSRHPVVACSVPPWTARLQGLAAGFKYPRFLVEQAQQELDQFIALLESLGVTVRRPDAVDLKRRFATPTGPPGASATRARGTACWWSATKSSKPRWHGRAATLRHTPTARYSRTTSGAAHAGAPRRSLNSRTSCSRTTSGPRRGRTDALCPPQVRAGLRRCGLRTRGTRSLRHPEQRYQPYGHRMVAPAPGAEYRIHEIESRCRTGMQIDTTFVLLAPGKVMVNPEYIDVDRLPDVLNGWDVLIAPELVPLRGSLLKITSMCGKWLSMNTLMIDEKRVIVERHHTTMLRALEKWGFEPIPCDLLHYAPFGGSLHCPTLDVRRHGTLESYV